MITADEIKDRLEAAAYVMRLLPPVKVQGYVTSKFNIAYTPQEIAFMDKKPLRIKPTNRQIDQMDEAILWLDVLLPIERKLVWKRAERIPWKILCREFGLSRAQINIKYNKLISKIEGSLSDKLSRQQSTRQIAKKEL